MPEIFAAQCESYQDKRLTDMIESYFRSEKKRLSSASVILIKPNLLSATRPEKAVTTHPVFVRTVIEILKKYTEAELWLGDSPGANFGNYDKVLEATGMNDAVKDTCVKIVSVESFEPVTKDGFVYSSLADQVDIILNLPKLKTHSLTGLTLAVKNLFGLIPGLVKVGFHRSYPSDSEMADKIYAYFRLLGDKTMNIMDGILAHEGDGPSRGTPIHLGIAAACSDAVALDIMITRTIGLKDGYCLTTAAAIAGGYDATKIKTPETNVPLIKTPLSKKIYIPKFMKRFVANKIYIKPLILKDKCIRCMLCVKSCPVEAISVQVGVPFIDTKKCIECYCCHEVCESDAVGLQRSLLHRMMGN